MLNDSQKDVIRSTIPLLEQGGEQLIQHFYAALLSRHPEVKPLFNQSHQSSGDQPRALARGIVSYARHIDELENLSDLISVVVNKHVALQVQPDHYPLVGNALLQSIVQILGEEVATPAVIEAWAAAYAVLADVLINAEGAAYERLASAPGGWRGARRFRLAERTPESYEITSFYFKPVDGGPILVHQPGQYIALRLFLNEEEVRRTYSLSSASVDRGYRISVKREPGGLVSNHLHDRLHVGDELDLFPPSGHFVLRGGTRPIVLISGGVGITPTLAMLEAALGAPRPIYFIHAARSPEVHAFREHVDDLARGNPLLKHYYCYSAGAKGDDGTVSPGPLNRELLSRWLPAERDIDVYFLGPPGFMGSMYVHLCGLGVAPERLHYEFFGPAKAITGA